MAVGVYYTGSNNIAQTLGEIWDGSSWSITSSPNVGSGSNNLNGVACTSSTSCTAVGQYNGVTAVQTLVESWNGTAWSITVSPNQGTVSNVLNGVACTSSTSCVAVGLYENGSSVAQTLVESWNGTAWSIVASPNQGAGDNVLSSVACLSSTSCMAVGYYYNGSSVAQTLVERWKGSLWTIASSPKPGSSYDQLSAMACTTSTSCVAAGTYRNPSPGKYQTLVETWNGTAWSVTGSPNEGGSTNNLYGVACTSSTSCMAVGASFNGSAYRTLVESWNGSIWASIPSPNQGSSSNGLNGIACTSATSCVAVGTFATAGVQQTLVESWNGSAWTSSPAPTRAPHSTTSTPSPAPARTGVP